MHEEIEEAGEVDKRFNEAMRKAGKAIKERR